MLVLLVLLLLLLLLLVLLLLLLLVLAGVRVFNSPACIATYRLLFALFPPTSLFFQEAIAHVRSWAQPTAKGNHILSMPATQCTRPDPLGVALIIGTPTTHVL